MPSEFQSYISELIQLQITLADQYTPKVSDIGDRLTHILTEGGKIFIAADPQCHALTTYFSEQLLLRRAQNLPSLPIIALPKEGATLLFQALATPQDGLIFLQSSTDLSLLRDCLKLAKDPSMAIPCMIFSHGQSGQMISPLGPQDIEIDIGSHHHPFAHTLYLSILHVLASYIDQHLFGAAARPYSQTHGASDHDLTDLD
jgi:phosphoheptose isomerase